MGAPVLHVYSECMDCGSDTREHAPDCMYAGSVAALPVCYDCRTNIPLVWDSVDHHCRCKACFDVFVENILASSGDLQMALDNAVPLDAESLLDNAGAAM